MAKRIVVDGVVVLPVPKQNRNREKPWRNPRPGTMDLIKGVNDDGEEYIQLATGCLGDINFGANHMGKSKDDRPLGERAAKIILKIGKRGKPTKSLGKARLIKRRSSKGIYVSKADGVKTEKRMEEKRMSIYYRRRKMWNRLYDRQIASLTNSRYRFSPHDGNLFDTVDHILKTQNISQYRDMFARARRRKPSIEGMARKGLYVE